MTFWRDSREPPVATVFFFSLRISLQKSLMYYLPGNHHLDRGYWPLQTKTYPVKRELKSSQIEVGLQDSCTMYTYMFDAVPMFSRSWIPFSCTGRLSTSIDILRLSLKNCIQFILYFHFFYDLFQCVLSYLRKKWKRKKEEKKNIGCSSPGGVFCVTWTHLTWTLIHLEY